MATLIIKRENRLINILRKYRVKVNGKELIAISNKESHEFDLPEGKYQVEATIDWAGSPVIDIALNNQQPVILEVGCSVHLSGLQVLLESISFLLLIMLFWFYERLPWQSWLILIVLWFIRDVLLSKGKSFIYYLTKGRRDYLYIRHLQPS